MHLILWKRDATRKRDAGGGEVGVRGKALTQRRGTWGEELGEEELGRGQLLEVE